VRRGIVLLLAGLAVAACAWPAAGAGNRASAPRALTITFTGKGGGRYLDLTRWLREDTRECYARLTADEDLNVSWRLQWTTTLAAQSTGYGFRKPAPAAKTIAGSVDGSAVRDSCDSADEEPGWGGTTVCKTDLALDSQGGAAFVRTANGLRVVLRGPVYKSPGTPCQLDIRNDQLVAAVVLDQAALARLAAGRSVSVPVGTRHPGPGVSYRPTRSCSHFPHLYDGTEYLYDCDDTLIWSGALTISPS
jgi:hypothetical protein